MHSVLWLPLLPNILSFPILFTSMVAHFYLNLLKSYLGFEDGSKAIRQFVPQLCNSLFSELVLFYINLFCAKCSVNFISFIFVHNSFQYGKKANVPFLLLNTYQCLVHSEYSIHACQIKLMICYIDLHVVLLNFVFDLLLFLTLGSLGSKNND